MLGFPMYLLSYYSKAMNYTIMIIRGLEEWENVSGYALGIDLQNQNVGYRHSHKNFKICLSRNHNYVTRLLHFTADSKFQ